VATESNKGIEKVGSQTSPKLNHWLDRLVAETGSDLLLVAGASASIRVEGKLQAIDNEPLTGEQIEAAVLPALTPHALEK
jgi:Tfp pilus assembly ATPase PilU